MPQAVAARVCAPVAQLDRALAYEARGRVFESPRAYHQLQSIQPLSPGLVHLSNPILEREATAPESWRRRGGFCPRSDLASGLRVRSHRQCRSAPGNTCIRTPAAKGT
jgi:hypothetical protein